MDKDLTSKNRDGQWPVHGPMSAQFWVIHRTGRIDVRDLTPTDVFELERRGYERFTIERGRWPAIVGFAENPADADELSRILDQQSKVLKWRK